MLKESGEPNRFATENPVPIHFVDDSLIHLSLREKGSLCDVSPTILGILGVEKPADMSGQDLRVVG
jgi:2,3-bisphosphoglycerate-independent phosphoglycerate mutase